jgi:hypothetical protein
MTRSCGPEVLVVALADLKCCHRFRQIRGNSNGSEASEDSEVDEPEGRDMLFGESDPDSEPEEEEDDDN